MLVSRPQNPSRHCKKKKQNPLEQAAAVYIDLRPFWLANFRGREDGLAGLHIGGSGLSPVFMQTLIDLPTCLDFNFFKPWLLEVTRRFSSS